MIPLIMAGVAAVGAIGSAIGGAIEQKKALAQQQKQLALAQQRLQVAQSFMADYTDRFGAVNTQLAEHYANLTDASLRQSYQNAGDSASNQAMQQYDSARKELQSSIQRANMSGSGAEIEALMNMSASQLSNASNIKMSVENAKLGAAQEVANQKMQYAQMGQNEKQMNMSFLDASYNQQQQIMGNIAQTHQNMSDNLMAMSSNLASSALTSGMKSDLFGKDKSDESGGSGQSSSGGGQMLMKAGTNPINVQTNSGMTLSMPSYNKYPTWATGG